jgi:hypothetical protein
MENIIHTITLTEEAIINAKGKKNSRHCVPVIGYSLNGGELLRFSSIYDAAKFIGADHAYLGKCINSERRCKGYKFFHANTMEAHVDEMIEFFNKNAKRNAQNEEDAAKWREQEAEKEAVRKAEEKRQQTIEKARVKVERLQIEVERKYNLYLAAMSKLEKAAFELKTLEDNNGNTTEMEDVA